MLRSSVQQYRRCRAAGKDLYRWVIARMARGESRDPNLLNFTCNICGGRSRWPRPDFTREAGSCIHCRSSVRLRGIVHLVSMECFGESLPLHSFPQAKHIKGIGLSDWEVYAVGLEKAFHYRNTYYHQEPKLDICDVSEYPQGELDFLVSTDVYEHVPPPVHVAFENAYRLLKPGGVFIFSVPYRPDAETTEHFPELHDFRLEKEGEQYVLYNRTVNGTQQRFDDLVFHGGAGSTLEMRVFGERDLARHFRDAGFEAPRIFSENYEKFGVVWREHWSLPWVARKPAA